MGVKLRFTTEEELPAFAAAMVIGHRRQPTEEDITGFLSRHTPDRALAAFDGSEVVGTVDAIPFEMTVPGGRLPTGGISAVVVLPTHRRRGILTRMMDRQLRDMHERGDVLSALHASESIIYGRFGYGIGVFGERWTIERPYTAFASSPEVGGSVRFLSPETALEVYPAVYERVCDKRQGMMRRDSPRDWEIAFAMFERTDLDYSPSFHVAYQTHGRTDGYVVYRTYADERWLRVYELMAATDEAYAALWQFCFGVDLIDSTEAMNRPVDDPLLWMLAEPRRLQRTPTDDTWLRLVDVAAALSGRTYASEGSVRFEVLDGFCPWNEGRLELEGGPNGAACRPTAESTDIVLSAVDLAAVYLGAARFRTLAQAARVHEHTPGAIDRADAMFMTEVQPWCPSRF